MSETNDHDTNTTGAATAAANPPTEIATTHMDYKDYSQVTEEDEQRAAAVGFAVGPHPNSVPPSEQNFPSKLHYLLDEMEKDGMSYIASWQSHGRCFMVHKQDEFVQNILCRWFSQNKFASFRRQLNIYGFRRIDAGPDRGGYYHELFLRGRMFLTRYIPRVHIKGNDGGGSRRCPNNLNFYSMRPLPNIIGNMPSSSSSSLVVPSPQPPHGGDHENRNVDDEGGPGVRQGAASQEHHQPLNVVAATAQLETSYLTVLHNNVNNAMALGLLRQHTLSENASSSSSNEAQAAVTMASHRQAETMSVASNNAAVDSHRLRLELMRAYLNYKQGPHFY